MSDHAWAIESQHRAACVLSIPSVRVQLLQVIADWLDDDADNDTLLDAMIKALNHGQNLR